MAHTSSNSSSTVKYLVGRIKTIIEGFRSKQNRDSTAANYQNIWRHFNKFILSLDVISKLWEERASLFAAHLVHEGVQSSTLKSYMLAIKSMMTIDGYKWNNEVVQLNIMARACKIQNDQIRVRLPIKKGLLELLIFEIERMFRGDKSSGLQPYLELLYKTILLLSYYGMMRNGELTQSPHALKASNIHIGSNKDKILIVLYTSKTHGVDSHPQEIHISANNSRSKRDQSFLCPFKSVRQFAKLRGDYVSEHEQFFIFRSGSPVKPCHLRSILSSALGRLGLNPSLYNSHSMRGGRTQDLFAFGFPVDKIKRMGRWKSNAVYKYLKH